MDKNTNSEQELWIASRRYMMGEINIDQLKEIEDKYNEEFNKAVLALAQRNIALCSKIRRFFRRRS
jgi:hypothetical protein